MPINMDKPHLWKADIAQSVNLYNAWFMRFAPQTYRDTRLKTTIQVEEAFRWTKNLVNTSPETLRQHPSMLPMLRMVTAPPLARDRLIGLAGVAGNLVKSMEVDHRLPPHMSLPQLETDLLKIGDTLLSLVDRDLITWLDPPSEPSREDIHRAATVVADRLCGGSNYSECAGAPPACRN
jgi:hypothetical protein